MTDLTNYTKLLNYDMQNILLIYNQIYMSIYLKTHLLDKLI